MVELLLAQGGADAAYVDRSDGGGHRTALHYALAGYEEANRLDHGLPVPDSRPAQHGAVGAVLVLAGAPLAHFDADGRTVLHCAARVGSAAVVRAICDQLAAAGGGGGGAQLLELRTRPAERLPDPRQENLTARTTVGRLSTRI